MVFIDMVGWWYLHGWSWAAEYMFVKNNQQIIKYFSLNDLIRTLFAPYRQTFAGKRGYSVGEKLRAVVDSAVSRAVGLVVRVFIICAAIISLAVNTVSSVLVVIIWPVIPVLPIIGVFLMLAEFSNAV
jgi:hypothetical protein